MIGFTAFIFQRLDLGKTNQIPQTQLIEESFISKPLTKTPTQSFTCDGRQHCSQMRSRAEAEYFIQHCPVLKWMVTVMEFLVRDSFKNTI